MFNLIQIILHLLSGTYEIIVVGRIPQPPIFFGRAQPLEHYKSVYLVKKVGQVLKKNVPTYVYCCTTIIADLRVAV